MIWSEYISFFGISSKDNNSVSTIIVKLCLPVLLNPNISISIISWPSQLLSWHLLELEALWYILYFSSVFRDTFSPRLNLWQSYLITLVKLVNHCYFILLQVLLFPPAQKEEESCDITTSATPEDGLLSWAFCQIMHITNWNGQRLLIPSLTEMDMIKNMDIVDFIIHVCFVPLSLSQMLHVELDYFFDRCPSLSDLILPPRLCVVLCRGRLPYCM